MNTVRKVVLCLSGGFDSYISAYKLHKEGYEIHALSFMYGQQNTNELKYAKKAAKKYCKSHTEVDISNMFSMSKYCSLISGIDIANDEQYPIKRTFLPNRNILFLSYAYNFAISLDIYDIAFSISDEEGSFPDATLTFIEQVEKLFSEGNNLYCKILLPVLNMDKEALYRYAESEGIFKEAIEQTYSCYQNTTKKNSWGIGCGECPCCKLRKLRYEQYLEGKK